MTPQQSQLHVTYSQNRISTGRGVVPGSFVVLKGLEEEDKTSKTTTKLSLEDKMKSWEATDEELKAASLGGNIPQIPQRTDGFDIGLYIAFPFMIIACLLFLAFPFIAGNLDVSSVGPPPTS
jgi:hypothetical protein